jgi:hypothetical protein
MEQTKKNIRRIKNAGSVNLDINDVNNPLYTPSFADAGVGTDPMPPSSALLAPSAPSSTMAYIDPMELTRRERDLEQTTRDLQRQASLYKLVAPYNDMLSYYTFSDPYPYSLYKKYKEEEKLNELQEKVEKLSKKVASKKSSKPKKPKAKLKKKKPKSSK